MKPTAPQTNILYYGDCLEVMAQWPPGSVDLIYLDPPFNSEANYHIIFGAGKKTKDEKNLAQILAFRDTWSWDEAAAKRVADIENAIAHPAHGIICALKVLFPNGSGMLAYLSYMAQRLAVMRPLLKSSGSIYLHCNHSAGHYLKILMDSVFGAENFRNEIIWCYGSPGDPKRHFPRKHDTLLFYANGGKNTFNKDAIRVAHKRIDQRVVQEGWRREKPLEFTPEKAAELAKGKVPFSWWNEFAPAYKSAKQYLGYPTQKPLGLLERIIRASSNQGGIVLDPFCGCGTTIEAAHKLGRRWLGIDISTQAIEVIRRDRLKEMKIPISGLPHDMRAAEVFARDNPFDFEKWAVTRIPGFVENETQVGDGGIDGRAQIYRAPAKEKLCIAQVKGGRFSLDAVRAFAGAISAGYAAIGVFTTLHKTNLTPAMKQCINQAGTMQIGQTAYNRLVMYSIEEYLNGARPHLPPLAHPLTGSPFQDDLAA
ncbi:MAG: DNA methyltransferase [Gammaproteobacteria bacterium]